MTYRTIVADPPWPYRDGPTARQRDRGNTAFLPYTVMGLDDIGALRLRHLAAPAAHIYLWSTSRFLWDAPYIAQCWGMKISQVLTWAKTPMGLGPGGAFANTTEFIVFGRMRIGPFILAAREAAFFSRRALAEHFPSKTGGLTGCVTNWEMDLNIPTAEQWDVLRRLLPMLSDVPDLTPEPNRQDRSHFHWSRGKHSAKPEAFIDLVEQVSPGPYLELFARRQRLGWDTWGNECRNDVEMAV